MKILNLQQGTKEWLDARKKHFTASDAPALMGASKYKTRKQLLDEKKGAAIEAITPAKQALFDKGHKAEDDARSVLELETMDSYLPCVGVNYSFDELPLMASFDGRSDDEDHDFEHKLWNDTLAENVRNEVLEPSHYWQLEHQLLVSEDDYVLFVVSDGTAEKREMMKYYPVPGRKEELIEAWVLLQADLKNHQIEAKQEAVVAEKCSLPAIQCSVKGSQITTNISNCLVEVKALAKSEMARTFETDQDFADKDQLNKDVKNVRAELKERVARVKGEFVSYSEFEAIASEMDKVLQQMQSHGEKQVKQAKDAKKLAIKQAGEKELTDLAHKCDLELAPMTLMGVANLMMPDFVAAMKGKRTIDSLEDAVSMCVNKAKIEINQVMYRVVPNLQYLRDHAADYKFLFSDAQQLVNQDGEPFQAIIKSRIADHKQAEAERLEAERQRIQKEEEAKAQREAEAKAEAERERIRKEERAKAQAEEQAKREREEAERLQREAEEKAKQPEPTPEPIQQAVVEQAEESHQGRSQTMRNAEVEQYVSVLPGDLVLELFDWCERNELDKFQAVELESILNKYFA